MTIEYLLNDYSLADNQKQNSTEKDFDFFSDADVLASPLFTDQGGRSEP